jgi:hypothetical protein
MAYLGVLNDKVPRRQYEGYQRGREKHLNDSNIVIVASEVHLEWIRMVETESSRGTWRFAISIEDWSKTRSHTNSQTAVVLVERHKVHSHDDSLSFVWCLRHITRVRQQLSKEGSHDFDRVS